MRTKDASPVPPSSDSGSNQRDARLFSPRHGQPPAPGRCARSRQGRLVPFRAILGAVALGVVTNASPKSFASAESTASAQDSVPCRVHQRVPITFPARALSAGIVHGQVRLLLDVNRAGELVDLLVIGYTRRDFADAALEAVSQWRFSPARIAGEPVASTLTLNVEFNVGGVLAYVKPPIGSEEPNGTGEQVVYGPASGRTLDEPPSAIQRPRPMYLREWIEAGRTGTVTVEFYIDEKGRVRFPSIVGEADEYLAAAALDAVKRWQFRPATQQGRPVLTRVRQDFQFYPKDRAEPDSAESRR